MQRSKLNRDLRYHFEIKDLTSVAALAIQILPYTSLTTTASL